MLSSLSNRVEAVIPEEYKYRINSRKIFMEHLLHARYWDIGFKYTSMAPVLVDPSPMGKADVKGC